MARGGRRDKGWDDQPDIFKWPWWPVQQYIVSDSYCRDMPYWDPDDSAAKDIVARIRAGHSVVADDVLTCCDVAGVPVGEMGPVYVMQIWRDDVDFSDKGGPIQGVARR